VESKQIVVNDILVRYLKEDSKRQSGLYCLFLHGWRSQSDNFVPLIQFLAKHNISSLSLDLPGFGGSAIPVGTYTLLDYANCVFAFVQKLKLDIGCVIGHSFGGRVAIKLTSLHPDFVKKLILLDSAGIIEHPTRLGILKSLAKLVRPVFYPTFMKPIRSRIYKTLGADDYLATLAMRGTYLAVIGEDLQKFLPQIKQPTLLLWGEKDTTTPLSIANAMKDLIPNSRLEILPNAGHFSFTDQPDLATKYILNFIAHESN